MDYIRDISEFNYALTLSDDLLKRDYLAQLKSMSILSMPDTAKNCHLRLIRLQHVTEACSCHLLDRMIPALNALLYLQVSIGYILDIAPHRTTNYLAIQAGSNMSAAIKLIENTLKLNCPDLSIKILDITLSQKIFKESLFSKHNCSSISSVTFDNHLCHDLNAPSAQSLKMLLNHMTGESFTLLFLATPADKKQLDDKIYQLENLSTLLDTFKETTFTYHKTFSDCATHTLTDAKYNSFLHTDNKTDTKTLFKKCDTKTVNSFTVNAKINDPLNYIFNTLPSKELSFHDTFASSYTQTDTKHHTETLTTGDNESITKGNNSTYVFKGENKTALELLKKTEKLLKRYYTLQSNTAFNLGIYFIAPYSYTALRASFTLLELLKQPHKHLESSITNWEQSESAFPMIREELFKLCHPQFSKNRSHTSFTPTTLVDAKYLAHLICLPTLSS